MLPGFCDVAGGSVRVLLTSRDDWTPSENTPSKIKDEELGVTLKAKGRRSDNDLDSRQPSQADWIKQYVEQQEEVLTEAIEFRYPNSVSYFVSV